MMHTKASRILMIRPIRFGHNEQTAGSNSFQKKEEGESYAAIQENALSEFDNMTSLLIRTGIDVMIFEDTAEPHTPDSVFPNNWISFHGNELVLYSMLAENRRRERRDDIIHEFKKQNTTIIDLSRFEARKMYLEGTGSIVFDYANKIAYANLSPRTDKLMFEQLSRQLDFSPVSFKAVDQNGSGIYHTNVMMCIGQGFAVVCSESIADPEERAAIERSLKETGHEIIRIDYSQMNSFAGNMYQLYNFKGESFILMSKNAFGSLQAEQVEQLGQYGTLLHCQLDTIEKYGGGSARCMIAEIR
ncbi:MAG: citrulline utilization hydrolase CtlX [Bacteroidia bacterium]